jgi:hypothetical protein
MFEFVVNKLDTLQNLRELVIEIFLTLFYNVPSMRLDKVVQAVDNKAHIRLNTGMQRSWMSNSRE